MYVNFNRLSINKTKIATYTKKTIKLEQIIDPSE